MVAIVEIDGGRVDAGRLGARLRAHALMVQRTVLVLEYVRARVEIGATDGRHFVLVLELGRVLAHQLVAPLHVERSFSFVRSFCILDF